LEGVGGRSDYEAYEGLFKQIDLPNLPIPSGQALQGGACDRHAIKKERGVY